MNYYFLVLRILHIISAVTWVGSTILLATIIRPGLKKTNGMGQKFIDYLVTTKRFGTQSISAGSLTGIAGLLLYWHDSMGLTSPWMTSDAGIGFGAAAVLGVIAYIFGILTDLNLKAMARLREQSGDAPTEEQSSKLQAMDKQASAYLGICAGTITLSMWIMAVARYLMF